MNIKARRAYEAGIYKDGKCIVDPYVFESDHIAKSRGNTADYKIALSLDFPNHTDYEIVYVSPMYIVEKLNYD